MDDFPMFVLMVLIIGALIGGLVTGICVIDEYFLYQKATAAIEQLRTDLQKVSVQESEDVIGQVTEWNQTIAKKRRLNDIPFVCLTIPNGWDKLKPLEIPNR